jgi:hypothetical protein
MSIELPNIVLKLNTEKKLTNTNTNTNTNTINNTIILDTEKTTLTKSTSSENLAKSSSLAISSVKSPAVIDNVSKFKDQFTAYLIEYFKNDMVLLNNVLEVSDKIVFKMDDLKVLISTLLEIETSAIQVEYEDMIKTGCCGKICNKIPLFKKINDIIINNCKSFLISYNTIAVQLQTEFNISLNYIII